MRSSAKRGEGGGPQGGSCTLAVKVIPGAPRDQLAWDPARGWVARITAPPVDGKANAHLCAFVARDLLDLPARAVTLKSGATSRQKVLAIALDAVELERRLLPLKTP